MPNDAHEQRPHRAGGKIGRRCIRFGLRPPCVARYARREADAYSRAASPRGCTRLRRQPLAGEPRVSIPKPQSAV